MQSKPKILIIYTGGTIGMAKDSKTGLLKPFNFKKISTKIPELQLLDCNISVFSFKKPIDSSNMSIASWVNLSEIIEQKYADFDGFIILHGSDTMSYSASALSFMLEHLAKPVIFTGSQLPIGDLRTDAKENLITSIQLASLQHQGKPVIQEVGLYFEYKLYRGNRTTKINAENFEAFVSYNYPELAQSGVHLKINHESLLKPKANTPLQVHKKLSNDIALIKMYPSLSPSVFNNILNTKNLKAVIIETYGSGNATLETWFIKGLTNAIKKGIHIINVTQCIGGSVQMGQYETSSTLKKLGVISGNDITTEAALCKLMYLLGKDTHSNLFKINFETSICGEVS